MAWTEQDDVVDVDAIELQLSSNMASVGVGILLLFQSLLLLALEDEEEFSGILRRTTDDFSFVPISEIEPEVQLLGKAEAGFLLTPVVAVVMGAVAAA